MPKPTSFRLPEDLLDRLDEQAAAEGRSATALVTSLLDEGLKIRRFPGVVYRDGPAGRRAALAGGPDVWEVIRDVRRTRARGERRVRQVADSAGLTSNQVRLAIGFYTAFPEEIDERIALDERAEKVVRAQIERRERLLSS